MRTAFGFGMMPAMEVKGASGTQAIVTPATFSPGDSFKIAELLSRSRAAPRERAMDTSSSRSRRRARSTSSS